MLLNKNYYFCAVITEKQNLLSIFGSSFTSQSKILIGVDVHTKPLFLPDELVIENLNRPFLIEKYLLFQPF